MNSNSFNYQNNTIKMIQKLSRAFIVILLTTLCFPNLNAQQTIPISLGEGITVNRFFASTVDDDNIMWFLTDAGIVSFNGSVWALHNKNRKVALKDMKDVVYHFSQGYGPELWIASPMGATVVSTPVDARSGATTYYLENSKILSENVLALAVGGKDLRWFGTDKGVSAFRDKKWLTNNYSRVYPEGMFQDYPISTMATSNDGDSLYVGTLGGGVFRVYRNDVDAVSGASDYAAWGPILMPSDSVFSIHIAKDGTQWFGTAKGIARHQGYNTLAGWTVLDTETGLADNKVQAIKSDSKGILYFGTKNGLSVYDGTNLKTFRTADGLVSNNILSITVDKSNAVWLGTDSGVTCYKGGKFISYK